MGVISRFICRGLVEGVRSVRGLCIVLTKWYLSVGLALGHHRRKPDTGKRMGLTCSKGITRGNLTETRVTHAEKTSPSAFFLAVFGII